MSISLIIIVVKIVSGAPAHDDQPAEAATSLGLPSAAIDYVKDKAKELGLPAVMLPNIGSVQGPMDGTGTLAQKIETFVPEDLFNEKTNIDAGTWYLKKSLDRWKEKLDISSLRSAPA